MTKNFVAYISYSSMSLITHQWQWLLINVIDYSPFTCWLLIDYFFCIMLHNYYNGLSKYLNGFVNSLFSDERTHAGFKRALEDLCVGARPPRELPEVTEAMTVYKRLHGREDKRKQEAGSRWDCNVITWKHWLIDQLTNIQTNSQLANKNF